MLIDKSKWVRPVYDPDSVNKIINSIGCGRKAAKMLVNRGYTSLDVRKLLNTDITRCHDPYLLKDMDKAVEKIEWAIINNKKIRVYGDYDADGVTSTALMVSLLHSLYANFDYCIPHREQDGYGMHKHLIDDAKAKGIDLIVTVDTGITAIEEIEYANSLGMEVVVTDHHEPFDILPPAYAVINPKRRDCPYPFKGLAGVGVAFKLAQALLGRFPVEYLQFFTIGTIADVMPLVDENRILVIHGLKQMADTPLLGIEALKLELDISGEVDVEDIGFKIGPAINACGRLGGTESVMGLLTSKNKSAALHYARELKSTNETRKAILEEGIDEAIDLVRKDQLHEHSVIVVYNPTWRPGIVGLIASRLVEVFNRPAIVLCKDPKSGNVKGSARTYGNLDVYSAIKACKDLLLHCGGHKGAAGLALREENISAFREAVGKGTGFGYFENMIQADVICGADEYNIDFISEFDIFKPFGEGFRPPRIWVQGLQIQEIKTLGSGKHLKLICDNGVEVLGWNRGNLASKIALYSRIDVIGEPSISIFRGQSRPQLTLIGIKNSGLQVLDCRDLNEIDLNGKLIVVNDPAEVSCLLGLQNSMYCLYGQKISENSLNLIPDAIVFYSSPKNIEDMVDILRQIPHVKYAYITCRNGPLDGLDNSQLRKSILAGLYQTN